MEGVDALEDFLLLVPVVVAVVVDAEDDFLSFVFRLDGFDEVELAVALSSSPLDLSFTLFMLLALLLVVTTVVSLLGVVLVSSLFILLCS